MTYIATLVLILTLRPPAYWIAFGPHGPRAEAPPGENVKIFMYVMAALGATGVIFGAARFFARGQPATMTKEYQEASNEYLKVCTSHKLHRDPRARGAYMRSHDNKECDSNNTSRYRASTSSPSLVSHPRATSAPAWSRASPRASKCTTRQESRERKKCSRISGRSSAAFVNIERRSSVVRVLFPCVGCSKDLFGMGEALYLTHASIYLPLYKDLCRQEWGFVFVCRGDLTPCANAFLDIIPRNWSASQAYILCTCVVICDNDASHTSASMQI
jgi:hypothetical protein